MANKKNLEKKETIKEGTEKPNEDLKKSDNQNKQVFWALILMVSIIAIIVLVPIIRNSINNFEYINLDFTKTKSGDVIFYSTNIPVGNINEGKITGHYSMLFREDPRELESIPINVTNNLVTFNLKEKVYISIDPEMEVCEDNTLALVNLAQFLGSFGGMSISSAVNNESYSIENNITYASCETTQNNTVIVVKSGEITQIEKVGNNCYELSYSNCEILPVTERFMTLILEKYMTLFEKK